MGAMNEPGNQSFDQVGAAIAPPVAHARFSIGDVVKHRLFDFRGVIFDIDPVFANSEEWYQSIPEEIRPPKDQPFYHLLAENAEILLHRLCQPAEPAARRRRAIRSTIRPSPASSRGSAKGRTGCGRSAGTSAFRRVADRRLLPDLQ